MQSAAVRKVAAYTMSTAPVIGSKALSDNGLRRSPMHAQANLTYEILQGERGPLAPSILSLTRYGVTEDRAPPQSGSTAGAPDPAPTGGVVADDAVAIEPAGLGKKGRGEEDPSPRRVALALRDSAGGLDPIVGDNRRVDPQDRVPRRRNPATAHDKSGRGGSKRRRGHNAIVGDVGPADICTSSREGYIYPPALSRLFATARSSINDDKVLVDARVANSKALRRYAERPSKGAPWDCTQRLRGTSGQQARSAVHPRSKDRAASV